jgi:putative ABC transport system substrate-binding protein
VRQFRNSKFEIRTWSTAIFVVALALSIVAAPLDADAQQAGKVPRVGVIGETSPTDSFLVAFRQGLRELGYIEGRSIVIEYRYAHGALDQAPKLAAELIRLEVDVLMVGGTIAAQSAKALTTTVPIVFALAGDPVGSGLVASLARPGGNATGMSNLVPELSGKQLELLKAAVPQVSRVTVLYNPVNPVAGSTLNGAREAARALAVELQVLEVRQPNELANAFSALAAWRAGALLALSDPVFGSDLAQLSKRAAKNRLPAMYASRRFAEAGGLLAYGPNYSDNYRRAATYVDKILKGTKPADLPVEQPTKFELVINLKTAKALGLTIPQSLLARADEVLQ